MTKTLKTSDKEENDSRGTLTVSKGIGLSPRQTLSKDAFKDTQMLFGSTAKDQSKPSELIEIEEVRDVVFNKTNFDPQAKHDMELSREETTNQNEKEAAQKVEERPPKLSIPTDGKLKKKTTLDVNLHENTISSD